MLKYNDAEGKSIRKRSQEKERYFYLYLLLLKARKEKHEGENACEETALFVFYDFYAKLFVVVVVA